MTFLYVRVFQGQKLGRNSSQRGRMEGGSMDRDTEIQAGLTRAILGNSESWWRRGGKSIMGLLEALHY